jgi:CRISPR/Cas system-associated exonuclease Cas4 (RecB family)
MAFTKWKPKSFDPASAEPFTISRSKIDMFTECPRCSYLDLRLGVKRPSMPGFTLNNAVDELFKREFDVHRANGTAHPLMKAYKLDAVPFKDDRMEEWRDALKRGIKFHHEKSNFILRGGIDDAWMTNDGELIVVDYKATSKKEGPSSEADLYDSYKKQMEVYQWLFRQNGFKVHPTGYFVYANGDSDKEAFDAKLEFSIVLIPYTGSDEWVEEALMRMRETLSSDEIPEYGRGTAFGGKDCEYCTYREDAGNAFKKHVLAARKKK